MYNTWCCNEILIMKKIKLKVVSYPTAKLLNEIGFDLKYSTNSDNDYYNYLGELHGDCLEEIKHRKDKPNKYKSIIAPTLALAQQWFMDEHKIDIIPKRSWAIQAPREGFTVTIYTEQSIIFNWDLGGVHETYNDALEAGIVGACEIIKNNQSKV